VEAKHIPKLHSGLDSSKIQKVNQLVLARQAHRLLALYPETMLIDTPKEIVGFMNNGQTVLLVETKNPNELIAYARLHPWPKVNEHGQRLFEFRSWIVKPAYLNQGYGAYVLHQAVALAKGLDLNAQIVAVVEKRSQRALEILQVAGGKFLSREEWPNNLKILLQEGTAPVEVIDITDINNFLASVEVDAVRLRLSKRAKKNILLSIGRVTNKKRLFSYIKELAKVGRFKLYATEKTHQFLKERGVKTILLFKISQSRSRPNIKHFLDARCFDLIINIPTRRGKEKEVTDGRIIRRSAVENEIPLVTDVSVAGDFIKKLIKEVNEKHKKIKVTFNQKY